MKDDGMKGGLMLKFVKYVNYVVIFYSDGIIGEYYYLKYKGVVVIRG